MSFAATSSDMPRVLRACWAMTAHRVEEPLFSILCQTMLRLRAPSPAARAVGQAALPTPAVRVSMEAPGGGAPGICPYTC